MIGRLPKNYCVITDAGCNSPFSHDHLVVKHFNLPLSLIVVFALCCQLLAMHALAQWSTSPDTNNAICTAANNQFTPKIVSDGAGGAIITWIDYRNVIYDIDVYAQRINSSGVVQWNSNGVAISTAANNQSGHSIVGDGAGGAIIAWKDYRNSSYDSDVYAQRINSSGVVQWNSNGVAISTAANNQGSTYITSDGAAGAIITWLEYDDVVTFSHVYAQRVDASGVVQWTTGAVAISTDPRADYVAVGNHIVDKPM
jgi:hypothetical protein